MNTKIAKMNSTQKFVGYSIMYDYPVFALQRNIYVVKYFYLEFARVEKLICLTTLHTIFT